MLHLNVFVPLFVFMLFPVWIPIIASVSGRIADRLRPTPRSGGELVVAEANGTELPAAA